MSAIPDAVEEDELHARIDGRLAPARTRVVDAYLAAHPEARRRVAKYAEQQQRLRAAVAAQTAGPIPARLRVARLLVEQRGRRYQRFARIAAAVALLAVGGGVGWAARDAATAFFASTGGPLATVRAFATDAIQAHRVFAVEVRHPVEVEVGQEKHLVQWLSKRLGRPLIVPDLTAAGFQLMGGRLLPSESGPAAQLMYQDAKGTRLTCYYGADGFAGETEFQYRENGGVGAFYWSDDGFGYAIAAKTDRASLLKLAEIVYRQTSGDGAKAKIPPIPGKPS